MANLVPIKSHAGPIQDEFRNVYKLISRLMSPLEGSGSPTDPALFAGQLYIDTSVDPAQVYIAVSAGTSDDWVALSGSDLDSMEQWSATAGQTIFDLTVFTYVPGANQIMVFAGAALQRITADFTETSSTRVTFVSGLPAGTKVVIYRR